MDHRIIELKGAPVTLQPEHQALDDDLMSDVILVEHILNLSDAAAGSCCALQEGMKRAI